MPPKSADALHATPVAEIRESVCKTLKGLLPGRPDIENKIFLIERALNSATVRIMVQNSDALWRPIYSALYSNLLFNIRDYQNGREMLDRLMENPESTVNSIVMNGPLLLNRDLEEIKHMQQEGGGAPKVSSNTGGNVRCPRCRQTDVYRALVQDRGGDEAFSGYYTCLSAECGHQWRRSGG